MQRLAFLFTLFRFFNNDEDGRRRGRRQRQQMRIGETRFTKNKLTSIRGQRKKEKSSEPDDDGDGN